MNEAVRKADDFHKAVAEAGWLKLAEIILVGVRRIVESLESGFNVLVHCSDGWDRTSQLCALAQIVVDPYFRTLEGFRVVIEKDWKHFGHQFAIRNGITRSEKDDQQAPIFTQFL
jgi:myotubularin-related protein 6/7/8